LQFLACPAHCRCLRPEDPAAPVLYVYEIQVVDKIQRLGVGRAMMDAIEWLGSRLSMSKMKLTVFKTNEAALRFYRHKLQFDIDADSPSLHDIDVCYEILSKTCPSKGSDGAASQECQDPADKRRKASAAADPHTSCN
jgi:hypothetical protein